MAGSYSHATDDQGRLLPFDEFCDMIEHLGDAYEMAEEMVAMIPGKSEVVVSRADLEAALIWADETSESTARLRAVLNQEDNQ